MTAKTIKRRRDKLLADLHEIGVKLVALQNECNHEGYTYRFGANTGNYDPFDDCYWTDFDCPTCGKSERVDGSISKWERSP